MTDQDPTTDQTNLHAERWELLHHIDSFLDKPMTALGFVWLGLLILDFTTGLSQPLVVLTYGIWALFWLDFLIGITIAPSKLGYLRRNWMTAITLVLPAFRVLRLVQSLRVLRAARAARSVNLVRLVTSLNRGMRAIGSTLGRRGIGYVVAVTIIVTFGSAAAMAQFESPAALAQEGIQPAGTEEAGLRNYGEALWWTAMVMTTMGSGYWPRTVEGRILVLLLSIYAFAIFGYITATIASYFVGQDTLRAQENVKPASAGSGEIATLQAEIAALRRQIATLTVHLEAPANEQPAPEEDAPSAD